MLESKEIKLVLDGEIKEFKDDYSIVTCKIADNEIHNLAVLKNCLEKIGITMNAQRYEEWDTLSFKINFETFNKITNRGAGRKKDYSMEKRYKECKVSELKMKLETMKKCDIITELGCPKTTFYRILKNIEEDKTYIDFEKKMGIDPSIWDFTS